MGISCGTSFLDDLVVVVVVLGVEALDDMDGRIMPPGITPMPIGIMPTDLNKGYASQICFSKIGEKSVLRERNMNNFDLETFYNDTFMIMTECKINLPTGVKP